uniref:Uncharacterized protein n=1 Tax=Triticum urartu TaxID=4572 RepID=A0A8R7K176_TRIUA
MPIQADAAVVDHEDTATTGASDTSPVADQDPQDADATADPLPRTARARAAMGSAVAAAACALRLQARRAPPPATPNPHGVGRLDARLLRGRRLRRRDPLCRVAAAAAGPGRSSTAWWRPGRGPRMARRCRSSCTTTLRRRTTRTRTPPWSRGCLTWPASLSRRQGKGRGWGRHDVSLLARSISAPGAAMPGARGHRRREIRAPIRRAHHHPRRGGSPALQIQKMGYQLSQTIIPGYKVSHLRLPQCRML